MVKSGKLSLRNLLFALIFIFTVIASSVMTIGSASAASYLSEIDTNSVYVITSRYSGKALEPQDGSTANATKLVQYSLWYADTQKWYITQAGDGYYYITNFSSGTVIDINGASTANGANAIIYPNKGGTNQQWQIVSTGDGYYNIISRKSGKYLDVNGKSTADGAQIIQYSSNGGYNQQWAITKVSGSSSGSSDSTSGMRDMSTADIVKDMGLGINLGNTFEACGDWISGDSVSDYETAWGSPIITKKIFEGYKSEGFNSVRIPVSWSNMIDSNYNINSDLMARIKEVVDWALECDLYVVINLHWDNGWFENFPTDKQNCMYRFEKIWTQVADAFKNYPDTLIFEAQNEELGWSSLWNEWSGSTSGKAESYSLVNEINQKFVDVVRNSGGNNAERHLLVSGYNTDVAKTCDSLFEMPSDPAGRCGVTVHYYTPATFCILTEDADWGAAKTEWGSTEDYQLLVNDMTLLKQTFTDKGIPVVFTEYGVATANKEADDVNRFISAVCEESLKIGACPMLWAVTGEHYDRDNCKLYDSDLQKMLDNINNGISNSTTYPTSNSVTLFSGSVTSGDHANSISISSSAFSGLSSSQISNAKLRITYQGGSVATWGVGIQVYSGSTNLVPWTSAAYSGTFEVSTDSSWSNALSYGINISGYNWVISKVELVY